MTNKRKGTRRERQAREIYRGAGFEVQPFTGRKWRETDGFGLFDFVALKAGEPVEFVQVKSNAARGIRNAPLELAPFFPWEFARAVWLVAHDREGWRYLEVRNPNSDRAIAEYEIRVDERESSANMGEELRKYLEETQT